MIAQIVPSQPKRSLTRAVAAALLMSLIAGGVALASAHFPQREAPRAGHTTLSRQDLPVYWYGPRHTFDR